MMQESLRVMIFQPGVDDARADDRLGRLDRAAGRAASSGAALLLCPELFLSGYHVGEALRERAEALDGPFARGVAGIARGHGLAIAYGYPEACGATIYNSALCIGRDGRTLANHRKLALPSAYERSYFQPHAGVALFDLDGWRTAILICYDIEFPEAARAAARAGAELILVPTALGGEWQVVAERVVPTRAFENGLFLAYADYAGTERGLGYFGGSRIVGPDGRERAIARRCEDLIGTRLDKHEIAKARERLPYLRDSQGLRLLPVNSMIPKAADPA